MNQPIVQSSDGITLVGGGPVSGRDLRFALSRAPVAVAADSGADRLLRAGIAPEAVIGDFDSLSDTARRAVPADRQHPMAEQSTTDFDKALRSVSAPFVLALGFAGARIDHGLSVFNTLVRRIGQPGPVPPCIVLGPADIVFAAPAVVELRMRVGERLSLFPFAPVTGTSDGLEWPIGGLHFAPDGQIGTSNRVVVSQVRLRFDRPGMLVILPRGRLDMVISALTSARR